MQIAKLSDDIEELRAENERLTAANEDLVDRAFLSRSALHRCKTFDLGLEGKTKEDRSCFRTTIGLLPPLFIKLCIEAADEVPQRLNGSWEEDVFLVMHHLRTGLSFHLMQIECMQSESTLSSHYRETVDLLGKKSPRFREEALRDVRPGDLLKHTPAMWGKAFPVDVTEAYVPKSGDRLLSRADFGHKLEGSLDQVDSDSVILSACENYLIDNRVGD